MESQTERASARPYHHGGLKTALLEQAEAILESQGIAALTLRAAARAAGVSHAAPRNHFRDLTGLLSELAAVGFHRFASTMEAAMTEAGDEPQARMQAMGVGYVGFARAHPGLFTLMFRSEGIDPQQPALREAIGAARGVLQTAVQARAPNRSLTPLQVAAQATALWSLVHGFAVLLLNGRLEGTLQRLPGHVSADDLLAAMLTMAHVDAP